jgi:hypothetical protein
VRSFGTPAPVYETTRCTNPEVHSVNNFRCENLDIRVLHDIKVYNAPTVLRIVQRLISYLKMNHFLIKVFISFESQKKKNLCYAVTYWTCFSDTTSMVSALCWVGKCGHTSISRTRSSEFGVPHSLNARFSCTTSIHVGSRVSAVGIAIGYGLDRGIRVRVPVGARIFSSPCPDRFCGPPSLLSNGYGGSFPRLKRPGRDADCSPPVSAEIKKTWTYTSTSPYVFVA